MSTAKYDDRKLFCGISTSSFEIAEITCLYPAFIWLLNLKVEKENAMKGGRLQGGPTKLYPEMEVIYIQRISDIVTTSGQFTRCK